MSVTPVATLQQSQRQGILAAEDQTGEGGADSRAMGADGDSSGGQWSKT